MKGAVALALALTLACVCWARPAPAGAQRSRRSPRSAPGPAAEDAAEPRRIRVRVVEVAGGRAYVEPGEEAGLRRGDSVVIERRRHPVIAASRGAALIDLRGARVHAGQRGHARVSPRAPGDEVARLPSPRELASFRGQWPRPRVPAEAQHPEHVPLGVMRSDAGRNRAQLSLLGVGRVPLSSAAEPIGLSRLRARVHAEPLDQAPLALDADVAAQLWVASDLSQRAAGTASRPVPRVYELSALYGARQGLHAAAGRLRYAASGLGQLDGARVGTDLPGDLRLAAFGGLVPGALDGAPDPDTSRFGAELVYEDQAAELRPRASVTAHGSRFQGQLDERRVLVQGDLYPGGGHAGGYAQVSLFDADNPFGAPEVELTAAGLSGVARMGMLRLGARADLQRPERSRWLASFLPAEWLCVTRPAPPTGEPERCYGDEARYLGQLDAGLQLDAAAIDAGGSVSRSSRGGAEQNGGFVHLRLLRLFRHARLDATASVTSGSLIDSASLLIAPGVSLADGDVDLTLRYRPTVARYVADTSAFIEHAAGASVLLRPDPDVGVSLDADAVTGRDVDLLLLQLMTTWQL